MSTAPYFTAYFSRCFELAWGLSGPQNRCSGMVRSAPDRGSNPPSRTPPTGRLATHQVLCIGMATSVTSNPDSVESVEWYRCAWVVARGTTCARNGFIAEELPVPLCMQHRDQLGKWRRELMPAAHRFLDDVARMSSFADINDFEQSVYFVQRRGAHIKIGYSTDVASRIVALEREHGPLRVLAVIPGTRRVEKALHRRFWSARVGGEWFRPVAELRSFIQELDA